MELVHFAEGLPGNPQRTGDKYVKTTCTRGRPPEKVPAEDCTFWIDFRLKDAVPEVEALKLLKEIYHWFGITDEQIPYVDSASVPQRVDRARYA